MAVRDNQLIEHANAQDTRFTHLYLNGLEIGKMIRRWAQPLKIFPFK